MILRTPRRHSSHRLRLRTPDRSSQAGDDITNQTFVSRMNLEFRKRKCSPGDNPEQYTRTPYPASSRSEDGQTYKTAIKPESPPLSPGTVPTPTSDMPYGKKDFEPQKESWLDLIENQTNKPGWSKIYPSWQRGFVTKTNVLWWSHHKD